jgi:aspartokinase
MHTHVWTQEAEKAGKKSTRVIMKFGGSSLANAERVDYVAKLIKSQIEKGYRPTVVCSAMGKTTNNLLNAGSFALEGNVRTCIHGGRSGV